jgi:DNA-directed RNA polymerase subunit beta'
MQRTTVGQLLINEALPPDLRDYTRKLDSKGLKALAEQLVSRDPDTYREVMQRLTLVGRDVAYSTGGNSFGLRDLGPTPATVEARIKLRRRIRDIMGNPRLSDDERDAKIVEAMGAADTHIRETLMPEATAANNQMAAQVLSGARGNVDQLKRVIAGEILLSDNHGDVIPYPIESSYADGLTPAEHWASMFGSRAGMVVMKFATQDAGYLAKQLGQLAHRLVVTRVDADEDPKPDDIRGLPVPTDTDDNDGALLAVQTGGYPRNTVITPKIRKDLAHAGIENILVRSPMVGGPPGGGVYARDAGVRERGGLPPLGDMIGLASSQAISEKLTQAQLKAKHAGVGAELRGTPTSGFKYLDQLLQVPKHFPGGATHAREDGTVSKVREAPAGGWLVTVAGKDHYVPPEHTVTAKIGDTVEAGDMLSNGIPNPAEIVKYKGVGDGRRYFLAQFTKGYRDSGMAVRRRNVELIARGLIDLVEMNDWHGDNVPGDVTQYSTLEAGWEPRPGTEQLELRSAAGKYLEKPVLHYTIGTKLRPSVLAELAKYDVKTVQAHNDPPPFTPHMVRAADISSYDPDAITRFIGSNQKRNLLEAVHYGGKSDTSSTSYVPARVEGVNFGRTWPQSILRPPKA